MNNDQLFEEKPKKANGYFNTGMGFFASGQGFVITFTMLMVLFIGSLIWVQASGRGWADKVDVANVACQGERGVKELSEVGVVCNSGHAASTRMRDRELEELKQS